ncbi:hypothetical protein HZ326_14462 [Fusarium oxysporum f. sp. albedinis]|nr:hypothetical protein HZ326_14462 [Fusarium oxysporum f. sp. albedinis]
MDASLPEEIIQPTKEDTSITCSHLKPGFGASRARNHNHASRHGNTTKMLHVLRQAREVLEIAPTNTVHPLNQQHQQVSCTGLRIDFDEHNPRNVCLDRVDQYHQLH